MTKTPSFAPLTAARQPSTQTIFRDTPFADAPFTGPGLFATDDSDQLTPLIHLGLAAMLLPTFAYTASVAVSLLTNGTLENAVRAMVP